MNRMETSSGDEACVDQSITNDGVVERIAHWQGAKEKSGNSADLKGACVIVEFEAARSGSMSSGEPCSRPLLESRLSSIVSYQEFERRFQDRFTRIE